jgi:hypothetical protein
MSYWKRFKDSVATAFFYVIYSGARAIVDYIEVEMPQRTKKPQDRAVDTDSTEDK